MLKKISTLLMIGCAIYSTAFAAAWNKAENELLVINTFEMYKSCDFWDKNGDLIASNPCYRQVDYGPYIEYGVTDDLTVIVNPFFYNAGLGDVQTGATLVFAEGALQYQLWRSGYQALSVQLGVWVPFKNNPFPIIEVANVNTGIPMYQYSVGGAILYGIGGPLPNFYGSSWYLSIEPGYDQNFGPSLGQIRLDLNMGWKSNDEKWLVELKSFNTFAGNKPKIETGQLNFDLFTLAPGVAYFVTKQFGIELGVYTDIYGTNTAKGYAPFLSIWVKN